MKHKESMEQALEEVRSVTGTAFECDLEQVFANESPRHGGAIAVLQVVGGLLGSIAFLGFLFAFGIYQHRFAVIIIGILFFGASVANPWILKRAFPETIGLFLYVIGCFLFTYGLSQYHLDGNMVISVLVLASSLALLLGKGRLIVFTSVLLLAGSLVAYAFENHVEDLIHVVVFVSIAVAGYVTINESKILMMRNRIASISDTVALAFAIAGVGIMNLMNISLHLPFNPYLLWVSGLAPFFIAVLIINRRVDGSMTVTIISAIFLLSIAIFAPAIMASIAIILLGYGYNRKVMMVLGILVFFQFTSQFYYDLKFTLLTKSWMLMGTGILGLAGYFLYNKSIRKGHG